MFKKNSIGSRPIIAVLLLVLIAAILWACYHFQKERTENHQTIQQGLTSSGSHDGMDGHRTGPYPIEALRVAFGDSLKSDLSGSFLWNMPPGTGSSHPGTSPMRGYILSLRMLRSSANSAFGGPATHWLLITASRPQTPPASGKCDKCSTTISVFILKKSAAGSWERQEGILWLTDLVGDSNLPRINILASGLGRQALRIENSQYDPADKRTDYWQNIWAISPGFPSLLEHPLLARREGPDGSDTIETIFVPAASGETDDPGQWIIELNTVYGRHDASMPVWPQPGITRLPFKNGHYQLSR